MITPATDQRFMRIKQAARLLGISRRQLYRWAAAGKITLKKHDHMTFVNLPELTATIAGKPREVTPA